LGYSRGALLGGAAAFGGLGAWFVRASRRAGSRRGRGLPPRSVLRHVRRTGPAGALRVPGRSPP